MRRYQSPSPGRTGAMHRPTLAHNDRGIAVQRRGIDNGVPHRLGIKVGVMVNKPWRDDPTISIDGVPGSVIALANPDDLAILHRDVGVEGGLA